MHNKGSMIRGTRYRKTASKALSSIIPVGREPDHTPQGGVFLRGSRVWLTVMA
jgi:hypothetical protein